MNQARSESKSPVCVYTHTLYVGWCTGGPPRSHLIVQCRKRSRDGFVLEREFEVLKDYTEFMEDDMGWFQPKVMTEEMKTMLKAMRAHPKLVKPLHRLESDVAVLFLLTRAVETPMRQIRMACGMKVIYRFRDELGNGFGSFIRLPSGEVVCRSGMWNRTMVEEHNSNFFEWQI
jgi:hypothetical protein